ncbi:hypothetical protein [Ferrimonas futtsuensis]|uniref:hypothetical protein n=1 Tax=Ferrimonas futtsuensis TaxID=364764 RepID=UPI0003FEEF90|nr:hypothetical protein [Ferrimonas futtsuensis]
MESKTPWYFWLVAALALLWNAGGALDYVMTQTRNEEYMAQFSEAQLAFFYGLPAWVVACWATAVWGGVLGALLLLLRREVAVQVFLVSFIAMVASMGHNFVLSNGLEVMGDPTSLIFSAAIFVISLGLYLFARRMARAGILR